MIDQVVMSGTPRRPTSGVRMLSTKALITTPNAVPMTTATARSMTLPRNRNSRNSLNIPYSLDRDDVYVPSAESHCARSGELNSWPCNHVSSRRCRRVTGARRPLRRTGNNHSKGVIPVANELSGKHIAVLATDGVEQVELTEP